MVGGRRGEGEGREDNLQYGRLSAGELEKLVIRGRCELAGGKTSQTKPFIKCLITNKQQGQFCRPLPMTSM